MSNGVNVNRAALRRAGCLGAAALLALTLGAVGPTSSGTALGPVIAITPNEVSGTVGLVYNPSISGRGETAGLFDWEMYRGGLQ